MLQTVVDFIVWIVWSWWYVWLFIMMTLESSFFPFPSEVAMIPAWYLISTWQMSLFWAFTMWTAWAMLGSTINYILGFYLWEKLIKSLIEKYWKYIFVSIDDYNKAETYFKKHWTITTFVWRLITVIRQYISIPAWVFKMDFKKFLLFTFLWAWLWNLILIWIWYIAWENKELINEYSQEVTIWLVIFIVIIIWLYVSRNSKKKKVEQE